MKELFTYLFRKKTSKSKYTKAMHAVNYISIAVFLVGAIVIIKKFL